MVSSGLCFWRACFRSSFINLRYDHLHQPICVFLGMSTMSYSSATGYRDFVVFVFYFLFFFSWPLGEGWNCLLTFGPMRSRSVQGVYLLWPNFYLFIFVVLIFGFLVFFCFVFFFVFWYLCDPCLKSSLLGANLFLNCNCSWVSGSLKS